MDLKGRNILVTGGSDGYGFGIAKALKTTDSKVWITGREQAKLDKTAAELNVLAIKADVTSGSDWDRVFETIGDIDILINNAGSGGRIVPVSQQNDDDIINTINTNLTGVILGCRRAAGIMTARRQGMIINISSICALYAWPCWSVYTAAKAGLAKFSHGLYTELRPYDVRVTCVTPSWGQTAFNKAANISGAAENPELNKKCISPDDLGKLIREIIEMPDHLAIPDISILPMIQDISPM